MASLYLHQLQFDDAIACYRTALGLAPRQPMAHMLLGDALLRAGDWPAGLAELEWRLIEPAGNRLGLPHDRRWRGDALPGGTLLIHAPDGAGDAIMCARYFPLLAQRCATLIVATEPALIPLFAPMPGVAAVVDESAPLPAFDRFADRLSLPFLCRSMPTTIPGTGGYLTADADRLALWAPRLPRGRKIGLVWASHPGHLGHHHRSVPVADLAPLWQVPDTSWINLQYGAPNHDIALHCNPGADLRDYADTAAILAQLDLLVSVDTATAHLAGALNRPVFMLLPALAEWRWMQGDHSIWYQSMRIFRRQLSESSWEPTVTRIAAALAGR